MNLYDAGKELGVSYNTIRKYIRLGLLPATKIGKSYRVSYEDIQKALKDGIDLSKARDVVESKRIGE